MNLCPHCKKMPHVEGVERKNHMVWIIVCCGVSVTAESLDGATELWEIKTQKLIRVKVAA